jgi:hypothetical protein
VTVVTRYPTSSNPLSGTWADQANAFAANGSVVAITRGTTKNSQDDCEYAGFDFDSVIPAGATINSVAVEVRHRVQSTANLCFLENFASVGGTAGAVNSDSAEPVTLTEVQYAAYARPGGGAWTRDDLLDANFKTTLRARNGNNATSNTWEWDYIRVVVDYTEASAPQTITPSPVTAAFTVAVASVVLGALTVTPSPVVAAFSVPAPAITLGAVTLAPDPVTAAWSVPTPTVSEGSEQTATPDAVAAAWSIPPPTIQIGALTLTPEPVAAAFSVATPGIVLGPVTLLPTPASAAWSVPDPAVLYGPAVLTPDSVVAAWGVATPTVSLGPRVVTPSPIIAVWGVLVPTVSGGAPPTPTGVVAAFIRRRRRSR